MEEGQPLAGRAEKIVRDAEHIAARGMTETAMAELEACKIRMMQPVHIQKS